MLVAVWLLLATLPAHALGNDVPGQPCPVAYAMESGCPFGFTSDMPPMTFCVYGGVALGAHGEVCNNDAVVIWSSHATGAGPTAGQEVYFGFVTDPQLVIRAVPDAGASSRARLLAYTLGSEHAAVPLNGAAQLTDQGGGPGSYLTLALDQARRFRPNACTFASYRGKFLGVAGLQQARRQ